MVVSNLEPLDTLKISSRWRCVSWCGSNPVLQLCSHAFALMGNERGVYTCRARRVERALDHRAQLTQLDDVYKSGKV